MNNLVSKSGAFIRYGAFIMNNTITFYWLVKGKLFCVSIPFRLVNATVISACWSLYRRYHFMYFFFLVFIISFTKRNLLRLYT